MICPCCGNPTDQQTHDGIPLMCNPCMEEKLELEIQAIESFNQFANAGGAQ